MAASELHISRSLLPVLLSQLFQAVLFLTDGKLTIA